MNVFVQFFSIFMLIWNLCLCVLACLVLSAEVAEQRSIRQQLWRRLENSNFNPNVIEACVREAKRAWLYSLRLHHVLMERKGKAGVSLTYRYEIPCLRFSRKDDKEFVRRRIRRKMKLW